MNVDIMYIPKFESLKCQSVPAFQREYYFYQYPINVCQLLLAPNLKDSTLFCIRLIAGAYLGHNLGFVIRYKLLLSEMNFCNFQ